MPSTLRPFSARRYSCEPIRGEKRGETPRRLKRAGSVVALREELRDGAPEPADDAVLLDRHDRPRLVRRAQHRLVVERLQRVHAQDARAHSIRLERVCDPDASGSLPPVETIVASRALAHLDRPAERELVRLPVDDRLARLAQPQVAGPGSARRWPALPRASRPGRRARRRSCSAAVASRPGPRSRGAS